MGRVPAGTFFSCPAAISFPAPDPHGLVVGVDDQCWCDPRHRPRRYGGESARLALVDHLPYGSGQRDADPPVASVPECRMAAANEHLGGVDMQTVEPQRCVAAQFMRPHDARSATPGEGN
jgi:hypothetical protein